MGFKFVKKNKKMMSSEAARETNLLSNQEVYSIAGDLHSGGDIKPSLEFTGKLSKDLYTISHSDGLIVCQGKKNSSVVVWNPCTGERKMIEPRTCYRQSDRFALGYSISRSYKILRCHYYLNEERACVFMTTTSESLRNHCCVFFCNTPQAYLQFSLIPKLGDSVNNSSNTCCSSPPIDSLARF
ncbi:PREDICTED: putative F-box/kelch-repeat protein At3g17540 [Brassica oleracea var. oleracea]|uniref:putative F-box/kelch-repeat protein At3g17540 n=1 Tax=Brassica oleracea var. oleracea TaxID=109376 RepID=UPI0006A71F10|nr:PREDICTED: putative F-box/kelch-repeat protein At3g17540 [Brassica oleracea var. oleracea]